MIEKVKHSDRPLVLQAWVKLFTSTKGRVEEFKLHPSTLKSGDARAVKADWREAHLFIKPEVEF
jgi:hypothetical protein